MWVFFYIERGMEVVRLGELFLVIFVSKCSPFEYKLFVD